MRQPSSRTWLKTSLIFATLSVTLAVMAVFHYYQTPIQYSYHLKKIAVTQPIRVAFNFAVKPTVSYSITPAVPGLWTKQAGMLGVVAISFKPTQPLPAGSSYTLHIDNVRKLNDLTGSPASSSSIAITTEAPAAIASMSPTDQATNVAARPTISYTLAAANHNLRQLKLTSDAPGALGDPSTTDDRTFTWHLTNPLAQGMTYHLYLDDLNQSDPTKRRLSTTSFTTVTEPRVVSATQTDHLYPNNPLTLIFDQAMVTTTAPTFNLPGSGRWSNATTYVYDPGSLQPGTSYSYIVPAGFAAAAGGTTTTAHTYNVSTPGAVTATKSAPSGNNVALNTTISFTFDQPVDQSSAQTAFSLTPSVGGTFTWNGNTMSFHPGGLTYQTSYSARLAAGITAVYGLGSTRVFAQTFSTTYQTIKLGVPGFHQQYAQSCEEASLRMILAFRGVNVSDMDILQRVGYNPRPRDTASNTWDNPYTGFVGDVNGAQPTTGYGVFAGPIAAAAQSFGRGATASVGVTADYLATQISAANPVIVWGYSSSPRSDSWNTSTGVVQTYVGEHARVVYGVAGKPGAVVGFYIHDPLFGDYYWTRAQLMANLNAFGNISNQAVVVN